MVHYYVLQNATIEELFQSFSEHIALNVDFGLVHAGNLFRCNYGELKI